MSWRDFGIRGSTVIQKFLLSSRSEAIPRLTQARCCATDSSKSIIFDTWVVRRSRRSSTWDAILKVKTKQPIAWGRWVCTCTCIYKHEEHLLNDVNGFCLRFAKLTNSNSIIHSLQSTKWNNNAKKVILAPDWAKKNLVKCLPVSYSCFGAPHSVENRLFVVRTKKSVSQKQVIKGQTWHKNNTCVLCWFFPTAMFLTCFKQELTPLSASMFRTFVKNDTASSRLFNTTLSMSGRINHFLKTNQLKAIRVVYDWIKNTKKNTQRR